MYESEPSQDLSPKRIIREIRYEDTFGIPNYYVGNNSVPGNKNPYLPANFCRVLSKEACNVRGDYLVFGYASSIDPLN